MLVSTVMESLFMKENNSEHSEHIGHFGTFGRDYDTAEGEEKTGM